jgi:hypothetical protein
MTPAGENRDPLTAEGRNKYESSRVERPGTTDSQYAQEQGSELYQEQPENLASKEVFLSGTAELTVNGIPSGELALNLEGTGGP